ncbi:MAG TPA: multidrug effflux MFS transporter [Solirubrobacteraceae bacterium]|nr:multidrug effflux MFS transporter [Solirubrobacteraceae bacterium]
MSEAPAVEPAAAHEAWRRPWPLRLVLVLAGLSAFAPLTTDLYLPALPQIARDYGVSAASVQVTLTASVLGIAAGQLLIGPLSDVLGRRRPLVAGLLLYIAASLGCAAAPSVPALDLLRLVQGFAGAAGIVIARAMVRDMYSGLDAGRMYAALSSVMALAPILAPFVGAQLLLVTSWRGVFAVQGAIGLALLAASLVVTHETLAPAQRHPGSLRHTIVIYRELLHHRRFMTFVAGGSLGFACMFAYISASAFVYQSVLGLSPQTYGLLFALNGGGLLAVNLLNARLMRSFPQEHLLQIGVRSLAVGGALIAVAAIAGRDWLLVPLLFLTVSSVGLVMANAVALSMEGERERAGSASALFGMVQFAAGAAVAPLVGLAGASAVPMGIVMALAGAAAVIVLGTLGGPGIRR